MTTARTVWYPWPFSVVIANQQTILANQATIITNQEKNMSALSDAVASVVATLTQLQTDNAKAFSDLEAAVAAGGQPSPDVAAAVTALGSINTQLQGLDTAALAADATTTGGATGATGATGP